MLKHNVKMRNVLNLTAFLLSLSSFAQNWPKVYLGMNAFTNGVISNYDKGYLILGTKTNYKLGWNIKQMLMVINYGIRKLEPGNILFS